MRKPVVVLVALFALVLLLVGYGTLRLTAPIRVTKVGKQIIQDGMTKTEVLVIMRLPPGDYRELDEIEIDPDQSWPIERDGLTTIRGRTWRKHECWWHDGDGHLCVSFDGTDRVMCTSLIPPVTPDGQFILPEETIIERIRRRLGI
jgi:hypothetical protein